MMFHNDTGGSLKKQWAVELGKREHTAEGLAAAGRRLLGSSESPEMQRALRQPLEVQPTLVPADLMICPLLRDIR